MPAGVWYTAVPTMMRRLLPLLLATVLLALTPAALASPLDQHWLAGLYDHADYDDAVLAVVESVGSVELHGSQDSRFSNSTVAFVLPTGESWPATPLLSSNPTRAPPLS